MDKQIDDVIKTMKKNQEKIKVEETAIEKFSRCLKKVYETEEGVIVIDTIIEQSGLFKEAPSKELVERFLGARSIGLLITRAIRRE